ncbi:hypothetical protein BDV97DRAFT_406199 [Delphinella strobiligena]|nr:hypothetical protein BDV97DRAFT_406199 [Delphinella strobiligena]
MVEWSRLALLPRTASSGLFNGESERGIVLHVSSTGYFCLVSPVQRACACVYNSTSNPLLMASTLTETRSLCLSADEEAELVRSVESLGGKAQALQFIEMVFKFGHSCVQQLLDDPSPGKDYSPDPATSHHSTARATATTSRAKSKNTVTTRSAVEPVVGMSYYKCAGEVKPGTINPCNGYRKEPYKTPRGLRDHLSHRHGWTSLEADYEARSSFGAGSQLLAVQQPIQQNTRTMTDPQNLYDREQEIESDTTVNDLDDSAHCNDRFDGRSASG